MRYPARVLTMTRAWLRAYRVAAAVGVTAILCVFISLTATSTLNVGAGVPIRTTWFLLLGVAVVSGLPLYPSFGLLEHTFSRARLSRVVRASVHAGMVAATAAIVVEVGAGTQPVVIWFILLTALNLLVTIATADKSWAVILLTGGGTIIFDHVSINSPVSQAMASAGARSALGAYAAAWLIFIVMPGPEAPLEPM